MIPYCLSTVQIILYSVRERWVGSFSSLSFPRYLVTKLPTAAPHLVKLVKLVKPNQLYWHVQRCGTLIHACQCMHVPRICMHVPWFSEHAHAFESHGESLRVSTGVNPCMHHIIPCGLMHFLLGLLRSSYGSIHWGLPLQTY